MKPILITIALLAFFSLALKAQSADTSKRALTDTTIYTFVLHAPSFPGGEKGFIRFLVRTVRYPASGVENHIQGKVLLTFVVEKDGSLTNIRVVKSVSKDIDAEAVRVINASPKWNPGMQDGHAVRVQYTQSIGFGLQ